VNAKNAGVEPWPDDPGAAVLARFRAQSGSGELESNPQLAAFFECWLDTFLFKGRIDPRLRELTILRVMWRCNQSFEWAHHYLIACNVGLSPQDIVAIRTSDPGRDLHPDVAIVARAADEIVDHGHLGPETFAAVAELFPDAGVRYEFLYLVAGYRMFASVTATTGTTAEGSGLPVWPPDGVGPARSPRASARRA
jgi:hypothetical protein